MTFKTGLHYTRGLGFFEQFRYDDKIKNYGIPYIVIKKDTFNRADIVRRRWLDNHFYGLVSKIEYKLNSKNLLSLGGGYNQYAGGHYGQLLFVNNISINPINEYYNNQGDKNDANIYLRQEGSLGDRIGYSADIQYRDISYKISGIDNDLRTIDQEKKYSFLNPKFAFNYHINANNLLLASFAVANREPDRSDLLDNPKNTTPSSEKLLDYELGYRLGSKKSALDINLYFMNYRDQLVLTGELNDVGNAIRTNVPKSHRLGLEVSYLFKPSDKFNWQFNTTISRNKISKFTEVLYDYTNGFDIINNDYTNTNIAFSPSLVVANSLGYNPSESLSLSLNSKYIGRQFLDNTSNVSRSLNPFTYSNLLIQAQTGIKSFKQVKFTLQINNLFNSLFSNNGYTYSYIYGDVITENFLFPQAGINLIGGISVKL
jgi:iron complex outermembrane receptor protein